MIIDRRERQRSILIKMISMEVSKFSRIVDEFRQWREPENRTYFDDYAANTVKILFGYKPIDYKVISHENKLFIPCSDSFLILYD